MIELIVDSEFEDLFDPKTEGEFSELEKNMIAYGGAYEAIKVWDDNGTYVILDGHHRWKVIQRHPELKYEVKTIKIVTDRLSAKIWILQNALVSKTLSSVRKIEIAEELRPLYEEQAKQRMLQGKADPIPPGEQGRSGTVIENLAKIAGVGKNTVHRYETVMKEGTPEQIAAMKSGEKAIKTVYNEIRPPKPKAQSTQSQNEKTDEEVERHGFILGNMEGNGRSCKIQALEALETVFKEYGENKFEEVLEIIQKAWHGNPKSVKSTMIRGMAFFIWTYENGYKRDWLIEELCKNDPDAVIEGARKLKDQKIKTKNDIAFKIAQIYNGRRNLPKLSALGLDKILK